MPSAASQATSVHASLHAHHAARPQQGAAHEPATPFADLMDALAPGAQPPAPPTDAPNTPAPPAQIARKAETAPTKADDRSNAPHDHDAAPSEAKSAGDQAAALVATQDAAVSDAVSAKTGVGADTAAAPTDPQKDATKTTDLTPSADITMAAAITTAVTDAPTDPAPQPVATVIAPPTPIAPNLEVPAASGTGLSGPAASPTAAVAAAAPVTTAVTAPVTPEIPKPDIKPAAPASVETAPAKLAPAAPAADSDAPKADAGTAPITAKADDAPTAPPASTGSTGSTEPRVAIHSGKEGGEPSQAHHPAVADIAPVDNAAAPAASADAHAPATIPAPPPAGPTSSEIVQPLGTNAAASAAPAAATWSTAVPLAGVPIEIAARFQAGTNRFEIRLDPPELGRIDVSLNVDRQGNVTSHLVVERSDTLDLLRRDAPQLERALQDAGLKTGGDGLQFSLRDQGFAQNQNGDNAPGRMARIIMPAEEPVPSADTTRFYGRMLGTRGGLDIRV